ncbi:MAG: hypothetical protein VX181_17200 [Pseudomonadota bacterium]|nr:hypothetical protein [Pseudomonadota bacterium]
MRRKHTIKWTAKPPALKINRRCATSPTCGGVTDLVELLVYASNALGMRFPPSVEDHRAALAAAGQAFFFL